MTDTAMLPPLYDEDVQLPDFEQQGPQDVELGQVRAMLVRLRQLEREAEQVAQVRKDIVASYTAREEHIQQQVESLRGSLQSVLEHGPHGTKIAFPDAGTIHLTTTGGNLTLANKEAAVSTYGFRFTHGVVDEAAMNAWARKHYAETEQVPEGYEVTDKRTTLVVKKP